MNDLNFVKMLEEKNSFLSAKDIVIALKGFPLNKFRNLDNLSSVLTSKSISQFRDAKEMLVFIESVSRNMEVQSCNVKVEAEKKMLDRKIQNQNKKQKEYDLLFESMIKAQGFDKKDTCISCGVAIGITGICKC